MTHAPTHTPLPWTVGNGSGPARFIVGPKGHTIARIVNPAKRRHDAAFIVLAVTYHAPMVQALKECRRYFTNRTGNEEMQLSEIIGHALPAS